VVLVDTAFEEAAQCSTTVTAGRALLNTAEEKDGIMYVTAKMWILDRN